MRDKQAGKCLSHNRQTHAKVAASWTSSKKAQPGLLAQFEGLVKVAVVVGRPTGSNCTLAGWPGYRLQGKDVASHSGTAAKCTPAAKVAPACDQVSVLPPVVS